MSKVIRRLAPPLAAFALLACARPVQLGGTETPAASTQVVIVSAAGKISTSTPIGAGTRVPPTPTFDPGFGSILTPLASQPTETPGPLAMSPTPELRPTRTPAATVTPFPTLEIPPTPDRGTGFQPPPTRTPSPPTPTRAGAVVPTRVPTRVPTATPADPNGDIADLANAKTISLGTDVSGLINGPKAVNSFAVDIGPDDDSIVVTLTAPQDIDHYRLYLISPGRQSSAFGQPLGASGRVIRYPTRGETGTWYVQVAGDGKKTPNGSYALKVETRGPSTSA